MTSFLRLAISYLTSAWFFGVAALVLFLAALVALPGLVPFFFFFFFGLSVPLAAFFGASAFGASGFASGLASGLGTWRWSSLLSTGTAGLVALAGAAAGVATGFVVFVSAGLVELAALVALVAYVELAA